MPRTKKSATFFAAFAVFSMSFLMATQSQAQTEATLFGFTISSGENPHGALIFDAAGNLYGTTYSEGAYGGGSVFELVPISTGGWTVKVLYDFNPKGSGGTFPEAGLTFDTVGNLYGTTRSGGATSLCNGEGCGTVFQLSPQTAGNWKITILHEFGEGLDGQNPSTSLTFDGNGNLYGTAPWGGAYGYGTAFRLAPAAGGRWTYKVIHNFGRGKDGWNPSSSLTLDSAGNLYGVTTGGGAYGFGSAFELSPTPLGRWTEKPLHEFLSSRTDGYWPVASLTFDSAGNLYGTTRAGGSPDGLGFGTVYELKPQAGVGWPETILYYFNGSQFGDGDEPLSPVVFDAAGNLYGTTYIGGHLFGSIFELSPAASGGWTESVLYSFEYGTDGAYPAAGVVLDAAGNLYGTTTTSSSGGGTVFEITR